MSEKIYKMTVSFSELFKKKPLGCSTEVYKNLGNKVQKEIIIPNDKKLNKIAEHLSILSNPVRLKIVILLSQIELPVCIISSILGLEQSLVSHHLAVLRRANIVGTKNVGKYRFYYLKTNSLLESILNELR